MSNSESEKSAETSVDTKKNPVTIPAAPAEITVIELKAALDNNEDIVLLDVRSQEEYDAGHVAGAYGLIPHTEVVSRISELPSDKSVYIYSFCRSGRRSGNVTNQLRDLGYLNAYNVIGGILAWAGAGLPIEQ